MLNKRSGRTGNMPYTDMWEIIDDTGTIHSGNQEEMQKAFDAMTLTMEELSGTYDLNRSQAEKLQFDYKTEWSGDLRLIQIHNIHR